MMGGGGGTTASTFNSPSTTTSVRQFEYYANGVAVEHQTPNRAVLGSTHWLPYCVLERDTLTPQSSMLAKTGYRKRWFRPAMTEKMLTGALT